MTRSKIAAMHETDPRHISAAMVQSWNARLFLFDGGAHVGS
jgi:hypothetical protein